MRTGAVDAVQYLGSCYDPATGFPRAADCFNVRMTLKGRAYLAAVEFTHLAGDAMDYIFASNLPVGATRQRLQLAMRAVEIFVESQLEEGWDPKSGSRLVLDGDAVESVISGMR